MQAIIQRQEFVKALRNINDLVNYCNTPILSCVYIKTDDKKIILTATNGSISYQQEIVNIQIKKQGNILINANLFYSIISKIHQDEIFINQIDDNILQVKTPTFSCEINLNDSLAFPRLSFDYSNSTKIILQRDTINNIKDKILPFTTNLFNNTFNITTGIYFHAINEKQMECVASDSFKMGYYKFDYEGDANNFIISRDVINFAYSILLGSNSKTTEILFNNQNCILKIDNILMSFGLFDNAYPNIIPTILSPQKYKFSLKLNDLVNALNTGAAFVSKEKKPEVIFNLAHDKLNVKFMSSETGNSFEQISIFDCNTDKFSVKFNQKYFSELLKTIKSEIITFNFSQYNGLLIISSDNPYFLNLILPIRSV